LIKPIYGVMAEFDNPTALVNAARAAREKGYRKLDAYSPFPHRRAERGSGSAQEPAAADRAGRGHCGRIVGYLMQYYVTVWDFPINIGGRPLA